MDQRFDNTLYLSQSGGELFWCIAGRNPDGTARYLPRKHLASVEAARKEGARLGMRFWGTNGGPFRPIEDDAGYTLRDA